MANRGVAPARRLLLTAGVNARTIVCAAAASLVASCAWSQIGEGPRGGSEPGGDGETSCVDGLGAGLQTVDCGDVSYAVNVPAGCANGGCGLVVDVHGATMSAEMENNNTSMREIGEGNGYVVVQPSAPYRIWNEEHDPMVVSFAEAVVEALAVDRDRVHLMGFSDGGMMTWQILCSGTDLFASVAPAAAALGDDCEVAFGLVDQGGCLPTDEDAVIAPSVDVFYMAATEDALVDYSCSENQRDATVAGLDLGAPETVAAGASYDWVRYQNGDRTFEMLSHGYTTDNPVLGGHCYPGSTDEGGETGQLFSFACNAPTEFHWGEVAMEFFKAHPRD